MALLLFRLGRWCAAHARQVIAGWVVLLLALGGLAATLGRPLTNQVSIPGSDYERVLEELQAEVPSASGGFGSVVLRSDTGSFSTKQRQEIRAVFDEWEAQPQVRTVIDPFATQQRLDDADREVAKGEKQVAAGQRQLDEAWLKLSKAQGQVDYGEAWLRYFASHDPEDEHVPVIERQLAEGRPRLAAGYGSWAVGAATLQHGRDQLADGRAQRATLGDTRFVTDDGYALAQVQFDTNTNSVDPAVKQSIPRIGERLEAAGVSAEYSVDITRENSLLGPGEVIGVGIAALVLLITLGSLVAAGLPLAGALVGVGVGLAGAVATTQLFEMHAMTPALSLMLGLAVGIDYALFIVNRHRSQLLEGADLEESIARAVGTSGSAVVVAGSTVVIALVALLVTRIPLLGQMGLVAAATVAAAVLVALTLTPALLHLAGRRVLPRRLRRPCRLRRTPTRRGPSLAAGRARASATSTWSPAARDWSRPRSS